MRRIVVIAWVALTALPARAGLIASVKEDDGQSLLYVEGKKLRMEKAGGRSQQVIIFDGDTNRFLQLEPTKRTYSEVTRAEGEVIAERVKQAMAFLPPEQRAQAEAMLGKKPRGQHAEKYEATGKHETIAGHRCIGYRKLRDGKQTEEGCYIPWSSGAVTKADLAGLFALGKFMDEILSGVSGGKGGVTDQIYGEIERAPGFPAAIKRADPSGLQWREQRLLSLKRTSISAERFVVPTGYSRVNMSLPE